MRRTRGPAGVAPPSQQSHRGRGAARVGVRMRDDANRIERQRTRNFWASGTTLDRAEADMVELSRHSSSIARKQSAPESGPEPRLSA